MDANECPCRGDNPRCFRCDGTGLMSVSSKVGEASRSQAAENERVVRAQTYVPPTKGKAKSKSKSILKSNSTTPQNRISPTARTLSPCPICGTLLRVRKLKEHIVRSHSDYYRKTSNGYVTQASQNESSGAIERTPLQQCPHCSVPVKNLAKHLKKVHTAPETAPKKDAIKPARKYLNLTNQMLPSMRNESAQRRPSHQGKKDHHDTIPDLDASRGWGGSFRDHGQFGSHPTFDAMDDESTP